MQWLVISDHLSIPLPESRKRSIMEELRAKLFFTLYSIVLMFSATVFLGFFFFASSPYYHDLCIIEERWMK
jgi:hypothetical protein